MRTFNNKEKEILRILNNSNGLRFQTLFSTKIIDKKIIIDYNDNSVKVRYRTKGYSPSPKELEVLRVQSNELHERIYLVVTLVNYFEKEGFISLLRNQRRENIIILGDMTLDNNGLITGIEDEVIKDLLLDYTDKVLIISTEFEEFIKNGFKTRDEKRQIQNLQTAWIAISVAILTSISSTVLSVISTNNDEIKSFNKDFNNKFQDKDSLFSVIDKMVKTNEILFTKFDSLLKKESDILFEIRETKTDLKKNILINNPKH